MLLLVSLFFFSNSLINTLIDNEKGGTEEMTVNADTDIEDEPKSDGTINIDQHVMGLTTDQKGTLLLNGEAYKGIGVNYFDLFYRVLKNNRDQSYKEGLRLLEEHQIPFVRFMAGGFWPIENTLYFENKEKYFELLDNIIETAEEHHVGLIPSFFWHHATVPDLMGEPVSAWGNPESLTHGFMSQYVEDIVTRYIDSPAIWAWEFGNEYSNVVDLPNAASHRPKTWTNLGQPSSRTELDELSSEMMVVALQKFVEEVRKHDPYRLITSGHSMPRPSAWNQRENLTWKHDTEDQFKEILDFYHPEGMDLLQIHWYPHQTRRFDRDLTFLESFQIYMSTADKLNKPLFVGEFGVEGPATEENKALFFEMIQAIEESEVPLAALWQYDFFGQPEWVTTFFNDRSYQLEAIIELNNKWKNKK
jgi:hypothetical protein